MSYDVIVIGLGAMGSAAAYQLASRGRRVLGLDAYERGHAQGSSHGRTRMIREAYYEAPEYVPLLQRSYAMWSELEAESGASLLRITGGLWMGSSESEFVVGALASARAHGLAHEYLSPEEIGVRFPQFKPHEDSVGVYEAKAGILEPEGCVGAYLDLAVRHGADLRHCEAALRWSADGDGVQVQTATGSYRAERLVIAAGPWAGEILAELRLPLAVWRLLNIHVEPTRPELYGIGRCPVYMMQTPDGAFFGFPTLPDQGIKFGRHDIGEVCTPETIRREVDPTEIASLLEMMDRYMVGASGPVKWTLTCMYTMTPDHHFVIDTHPDHDQVIYACGFSGHGFKFASVIGEILADLATDGATRHPVEFLSAGRFAAEADLVAP